MTRFRLLTIFESDDYRRHAGSKQRVDPSTAEWFPDDSLFHRIVRELAVERILPVKELCESFEFFACTRRFLRGPVLADLCCGHGLTGLLFAAVERHLERVDLVDRRRPPSHERVRAAVLRAAPWVEAKVRFVEADLPSVEPDQPSNEPASRHSDPDERPLAPLGLPPGSATIGVHACGRASDRILALGAALGGPVAVMPCCRDHSLNEAPPAITETFGGDLACDIDRTYRMEARGYRVRWREVSDAITPMNRVLIATPSRDGGRERERRP